MVLRCFFVFFQNLFNKSFKGFLWFLWSPLTRSNIRRFDGLTGSPGKGQEEGQEDQGRVKELGGTPLAVLGSPGPPGLSPGPSLGSLAIPETSLRRTLVTMISVIEKGYILSKLHNW